MATFSEEKNNFTHGSDMSRVDTGVEEQELAIGNSVDKSDATYLYKGTTIASTSGVTKYLILSANAPE